MPRNPDRFRLRALPALILLAALAAAPLTGCGGGSTLKVGTSFKARTAAAGGAADRRPDAP